MKIATRFFLFIAIISFQKISVAQLVTTSFTSAQAAQLAQELVGSGVSISNAVLTTVADAAGDFTQTGTNIGLNSGVLLTSGSVFNAPGPNTIGSRTTDNLAPGDPDLDALTTNFTQDATILEFDVSVTADTLSFDYVFSSEEFNDFVGTGFNDVFGFFISGPGITGTQNIAIIPNSGGTPVTINNVNCGSFGQYYICNDIWDPNGGGCTTECPTYGSATTIEYDGFTVVLQAKTAVQACQTYHLKLAVADAGDGAYDSGVFIKEGSLNSYGNSVVGVTGYVDPNTGQSAVVENCADGQFNFILPDSSSDTTIIYFQIGGSATSGADYTPVPDSVIILPGDTFASINIHPIDDGITDNGETIVVYLFVPCSSIPYDSAVITILDYVVADAGPDTAICIGDTVQLMAGLAPTYSWVPSAGLSCSNCQNPTSIPGDTTTYILTITVGPCIAHDTVVVFVDQPLHVIANPDQIDICNGQSAQLNAINGTTYSWDPPTGLDNPNIANPMASPSINTTYYVTGTNGCLTTVDSVEVDVHPAPTVTAAPDTSVCPQQPVQLTASGATNYVWSPGSGLNDSTIANLVATVGNATTFTVTGTNQFGCSASASVSISTIGGNGLITTPDDSVYLGNSIQLNATGGGTYSWQPPTGLDDPNSCCPWATPTQTTTYVVTIVNDQGCIIYDSVRIVVKTDAIVFIPSAFSPNHDGQNDFMQVLYRGVFNLSNFSIYNRWGQVIFTSNDLSSQGWDGTYDGKDQEVGVYVYYMSGSDYKGNAITRQGNITLVR